MPDSTQSKDQPLRRRVVRDRVIPDYTGDRYHASQLAKNIQAYYHQQGYTDVRIWVEAISNNFGKKLWGVRGNITFSVPKL